MATPKKQSTPAPAPDKSAPALETPPAQPVTAAELNMHVDAPAADEDAINAISTPELPGQIPGQSAPDAGTPPAPAPGPQHAYNPATVEKYLGELDSEGNTFNPEIHDAKKEKNSDGVWKKKRGRKSGAVSTARPAPGAAAPSVVGTADAPGQQMLPGMEGVAAPDRFDTAAEMYAQTGYVLLGAVFSAPEEWQPDSPAEHENIRRAVASYLRFKQSDDLPPGMALALALGSFAVPRVMRPKTKATFAKYLGGARSLLSGRRAAPESVPSVEEAEKALHAVRNTEGDIR